MDLPFLLVGSICRGRFSAACYFVKVNVRMGGVTRLCLFLTAELPRILFASEGLTLGV